MSEALPTPEDFSAWYDLRVRLADDDHYGHVNNARYYEYVDTAVNGWLTEQMGVHVRDLPALGVVVASACRFHQQISFPDRLRVGIAVERVGRTSVAYRPALFRATDEGLTLAAAAEFVHVYVDPETRRPVPVPDRVRSVVLPLTTT